MPAPAPRVTHAFDGDVVLFLIGVRLHQPWRLGVVGRVLAAMPRMIAELERNRQQAARGEAEDLGYLGARTLLDGGHPTVLQYWRSTEQSSSRSPGEEAGKTTRRPPLRSGPQTSRVEASKEMGAISRKECSADTSAWERRRRCAARCGG